MIKKFKRVPTYFWDMEGSEIVVRSDKEDFPIVDKFPFIDNAVTAIDMAEKLIKDLKAGRKVIK